MTGKELEARLGKFTNCIIRLSCALPPGRGSAHFADQMLRSATGARANYAEARAAESRRDFAHKVALTLKELRELLAWLDGVRVAGLVDEATGEELMQECDELVAIFCASRATARRNLEREERRGSGAGGGGGSER